MTGKTLKSKNIKLIGLTLFVDAIVVWVIVTGGEWTPLLTRFGTVEEGILKSAGLTAVATVLTLCLSALLNSDSKAKLVFWRWKNVLPGHRALELASRDPRIDLGTFKATNDPWPSDPREQNARWYKLLKKHDSNDVVQESHQMYLLFRDLAAISAVLLLLIIILVVAGLPWGTGTQAFLAISAQYLATALAARNHGERLVTTVLAAEYCTPTA